MKEINKFKTPFIPLMIILCLIISACNDYYKNDYNDNTPTSGELNVYYDEGLELHVKNQAYTFQSQYTRAKIHLKQSNDDKAVEALYKDSCEAIIISRLLNKKEMEAFASKKYAPKYSVLAYSGLAFVANIQAPIKHIKQQEIISLVAGNGVCKDSLLNDILFKLILDKNNSSVAHYVVDSIVKENKLSANVSALESTIEALNYISNNKNSIACIDFAWLSDIDDSISKYYLSRVKLLGIELDNGAITYPSQSSFKLNTYPYTRKIYCYRKTGDFTLAKGFESFVAGPKGQMTFLKQGLLPYKQQERMIEVKFEAMETTLK